MGKLPVAGCMWIPRLRPPVLRLDGGGAGLLVPRDHLATPSVDPARLAVVAGEPDGIAGFQVQRLRREGLHLARAPLPQTPIHLAPVLGFERDRDLGRVDALHPVGFAPRHTLISIVAGEPDNIALVVTQGIARLDRKSTRLNSSH